jgi:predicted lipoprotein with Yx(FWY)xxD motif
MAMRVVARGVVVVALAGSGVAAGVAVGGTSAPMLVAVKSAQAGQLGRVLVAGSGRTLYHNSSEPKGTVRCTGRCAVSWPPLLVPSGVRPVAGPGVRASMLGTIKRPDGKIQVTYDGLPLYLYSGDATPRSTHGQGIAELGGTWRALATTGKPVTSVTGAGPAGNPSPYLGTTGGGGSTTPVPSGTGTAGTGTEQTATMD